ncbi:hypothetical protein PanWU01x14_112320 [Parasponia andersonii]|uniref:Uncharacterized protein n=1 Tax=Parasponia andersonii TaxID=3476 RepID=A0A2P5CYD8_PARAD|nr:hypothetical protein PanWU01x14_112320 [Parasponia andersonii]
MPPSPPRIPSSTISHRNNRAKRHHLYRQKRRSDEDTKYDSLEMEHSNYPSTQIRRSSKFGGPIVFAGCNFKIKYVNKVDDKIFLIFAQQRCLAQILSC